MVDPVGNVEITWRLLADEQSVRREVERLREQPVVGLDTETYWDAATNAAKVSLVQLAAGAGDVLVIDALAVGVEPMRDLLELPDVWMVAHNARFDELVLLDAGLRPQGLVDTLQLARIALDLPSYSLTSVTEHLFGLPLDKSLQKSNWRRRPLTRAHLAYAAADARMTLRVYEELRRLLTESGTLEHALRAATLVGAPRRERTSKRRVAPRPPLQLTPEEKRLVTKLKKWRLERAHAQRVPAYMICPDRTLEHLARERPASVEALLGIHGLGESKVARFGEELLQALRAAAEE